MSSPQASLYEVPSGLHLLGEIVELLSLSKVEEVIRKSYPAPSLPFVVEEPDWRVALVHHVESIDDVDES